MKNNNTNPNSTDPACPPFPPYEDDKPHPEFHINHYDWINTDESPEIAKSLEEGNVAAASGLFDKSFSHFHDALTAATLLGDVPLTAVAFSSIAIVYANLQRWNDAENMAKLAIQLATQVRAVRLFEFLYPLLARIQHQLAAMQPTDQKRISILRRSAQSWGKADEIAG